MCASAGTARPVEPNTVKEGNIITGHVIEKDTEKSLAYATILIVETAWAPLRATTATSA